MPDGVPASKVAGTDLADVVVPDLDATIVIAHSEKENAAATFKRTFGYHPLGVWCDNTSEFLAAKIRSWNAGSNTAADPIEVLRKRLLIRSDGAGASHRLLDWLTEQGKVLGRSVEYSVGSASPRSSATRVIVRRERPHPGAQLSLFEERDGWRYQAFVTNTTTGQLAFLEARHRALARVEDRIRHAKDTGLGRFPSREFKINQTCLTLVQVAADLVAWTRLLGCAGEAAVLATCEPKALRCRVPPHARPTRPWRPPTSPADPGIVAMGGRDRLGLRQHLRDPATSVTLRPSHHEITTRRTAALQRQPVRRRSHDHPEPRAHSITQPRHDCGHRHERAGLASDWCKIHAEPFREFVSAVVLEGWHNLPFRELTRGFLEASIVLLEKLEKGPEAQALAAQIGIEDQSFLESLRRAMSHLC